MSRALNGGAICPAAKFGNGRISGTLWLDLAMSNLPSAVRLAIRYVTPPMLNGLCTSNRSLGS